MSIALKGRTAVDGGWVAHQVEGDLAAPALLLLPGQANNHQWWTRARPLLAGRFFTVTFDYRGTGGSPGPEADSPDWTARLFADDAAAVLRAVGRDSAYVYGTSMGGRVAQELAINCPGLVRRLVLACTSPGGDAATERGNDVRRSLADPDPAKRHRAMVDLFYSPGWTQAHGGYDQVPAHLLGDRSMTSEARRQHLRLSAGHDAASRLHQIQAPTLIMHGDEDRLAPPVNAQTLGRLIPRSEVRIVGGGRHGFFDEFAEPVTKTVTDFLTADR